MEQAWGSGLFTGLGLIVVIGAQNLFVLTNGMGGRNLVLVPAVCFFCDAVLLTLGVGGFGTLVSRNPVLLAGASLAGAGFLGFYGWRALRDAFGTRVLEAGAGTVPGRRAVLGAALAITLLNPHVYLDTVVVMGSASLRFPGPAQLAFLAGAATASFLWFFGLSLAGKLLAPALGRPRVWKVLNLGVCALLWSQALGLLLFAVQSWGRPAAGG